MLLPGASIPAVPAVVIYLQSRRQNRHRGGEGLHVTEACAQRVDATPNVRPRHHAGLGGLAERIDAHSDPVRVHFFTSDSGGVAA
jgi:hypothetical protein